MNQNIECDKCPEGYIYNDYNYIPCHVSSFQYNNVCIECPKKHLMIKLEIICFILLQMNVL